MRGEGSNAAQLLGRAEDALRKEDFSSAVVAYEEALRADDGNALAHYNFGLSLARLDRLDDAIAALSRSLEPRGNMARTGNRLQGFTHS